MVFLSSSTSPRTSTVIFCDRSPLATAVVTSAMLRTWLVRLPASRFTLSVRSFQVPDTPFTSAWPPSLPSVPTSLATRVTSAAKVRSCSTIVLMVFLSSRISPWASTVIFCERSPLATAVVTSGDVADLVGQVAGQQVHVVGEVLPGAGDARAPWPARPACPRCRPRGPRVITCSAKMRSVSVMSLMVSASAAISPLASTENFCDRSPLATAVDDLDDAAHLAGQVARPSG